MNIIPFMQAKVDPDDTLPNTLHVRILQPAALRETLSCYAKLTPLGVENKTSVMTQDPRWQPGFQLRDKGVADQHTGAELEAKAALLYTKANDQGLFETGPAGVELELGAEDAGLAELLVDQEDETAEEANARTKALIRREEGETGCVFDEILFFNFPNVGRHELREASIYLGLPQGESDQE
ncbi:hypothetical protein PR003_g28201 [Phytophthora rubi]|uniref:Uncharacterized protein n=1 Tax=Phytophthora rubi TaxID=129364 RepID=A0A6A4BW11_9STRA|nr:hypothetical protein PR003_g28201 [Phytophthora rubi]